MNYGDNDRASAPRLDDDVDSWTRVVLSEISGEPANERRGMSSSDGDDRHSPVLLLALLMSMIRAEVCF